MSRVSRFLMLTVVVVALFVQASVAFAAPVGWQTVDVTVHSEQEQSILLVSGELPADAKLPYEAELAVPMGTQLSWIGEILGGEPADDPELQYTKTTVEGMDIYRFTLTQARIAQVEGTVPAVTAFDGTNYATSLTWTAWQPVPEVRISQRIPQGAQVVQAAQGATVQPGGTGYSYYTKTVTSPKAGDVLDLTYSYALPAAGATGSGAGGASGSTVAPIILAIVVLGGLALLFVNVNKKMAQKAAVVEAAPTTSRKASARAAETESEPELELESEPAPRKRMSPVIPMFIVIGVLVLGFVIAGSKGTTAAVANGQISRDFGSTSPCQSASLSYTATGGADLAKDGEQILKGFEGMEGVGTVTINLNQSTIDMEWCESSQTEESMRQVLSMSGLITLGGSSAAAAPSAPTTATIDADGTLQTASVDTSNGTFSPSTIVLKAGVPAEIAFGAAAGCVTEVVSEKLGINQDLSKGPATVKLPALEPGTYDFACAMGHQSGRFVVE